MTSSRVVMRMLSVLLQLLLLLLPSTDDKRTVSALLLHPSSSRLASLPTTESSAPSVRRPAHLNRSEDYANSASYYGGSGSGDDSRERQQQQQAQPYLPAVEIMSETQRKHREKYWRDRLVWETMRRPRSNPTISLGRNPSSATNKLPAPLTLSPTPVKEPHQWLLDSLLQEMSEIPDRVQSLWEQVTGFTATTSAASATMGGSTNSKNNGGSGGAGSAVTEGSTTSPKLKQYSGQYPQSPPPTTGSVNRPRPLARQGEWAAYVDTQDTGRVYYFNGRTGESSWDPPTQTFPDVVTPLATEGDWDAHIDHLRTGRIYYFNRVTCKSTWERPTSTFPDVTTPAQITQRKVREAAKRASPSNQKRSTPSSRAHWVAYQEPHSHRVYYYNALTGEYVWDKRFFPWGATSLLFDASGNPTLIPNAAGTGLTRADMTTTTANSRSTRNNEKGSGSGNVESTGSSNSGSGKNLSPSLRIPHWSIFPNTVAGNVTMTTAQHKSRGVQNKNDMLVVTPSEKSSRVVNVVHVNPERTKAEPKVSPHQDKAVHVQSNTAFYVKTKKTDSHKHAWTGTPNGLAMVNNGPVSEVVKPNYIPRPNNWFSGLLTQFHHHTPHAHNQVVAKAKVPGISGWLGSSKDMTVWKKRGDDWSNQFAQFMSNRVLGQGHHIPSKTPYFVTVKNRRVLTPHLTGWTRNGDGTITGMIHYSNNFAPGIQVTTSAIISGSIRKGGIVRTASGSEYYLL